MTCPKPTSALLATVLPQLAGHQMWDL